MDPNGRRLGYTWIWDIILFIHSPSITHKHCSFGVSGYCIPHFRHTHQIWPMVPEGWWFEIQYHLWEAKACRCSCKGQVFDLWPWFLLWFLHVALWLSFLIAFGVFCLSGFQSEVKMARHGRRSVLSVCLGAAALVLCWQMVSPAFIQPKQNRGLEAAAPAALGALASMAGTMPAEALKGPLAGTDLCTKPLIYFIYPLCDPLFLVCPLYNFPLVLGFFAALVTVINLILPETQPDEDLRVG